MRAPFQFNINYVDFMTTTNITDFISSPVRLKRDSASDSIVYRGSWKDTMVYAKTFSPDVTSLMYEKEVYRFIKATIDKNPEKDSIRKHFISPIFTCAYGPADLQRRIAVVTEDTGGISASNLMKNIDMTPLEYLALLFQVLYIVSLLDEMGISHNDIHLGNIIVTPRAEGLFQDFRHNGGRFDIYPHGSIFTCKIYDFDRASSVLGENAILDGKLCTSHGQCNRLDSQKDVFNVLMLIHVWYIRPHLMIQFQTFFWEEMDKVDSSEAARLKSIVRKNTSQQHWQTFCDAAYAECRHISSPLLRITTFTQIFCAAMKRYDFQDAPVAMILEQ
jgi:serine/threonine protein kinase